MIYLASYSLRNIAKMSRIILSILVFLLTFGPVFADRFVVCEEGCPYNNITAAVSAAKSGDVIEVHSGTYNENINVSKPVVLRGIDTGKGKPIVDSGQKGSAITLSADGIEIDGFEVRTAVGNPFIEWAGIKVASNDNIVSNNLADNNDNGIFLVSSRNNTLLGNNVTRNTNGILLKRTYNNTINANHLAGNNYGLRLISSANNMVVGNQVTDNDHGILLESSEGNALRDNRMYNNSYNFGADGVNNIFRSNLVDNKPVIYLVGASGNIIDSSSQAGTIYCINCTNITIRGQTLKNNSCGICLSNTTNSIIEKNSLNDNLNGIYLVGSHRNSIADNNVNHNVNGIALISSKYNRIENNIASDNDDTGLFLSHSNYNNVSSNKARMNNKGLSILDSGFDWVSANNLSENSIAIHFKSAWLSDIYSNHVFNNTEGILLDSSSKNNIINNVISNNGKGLLYDPLDKNAFSNNSMLNNSRDKEEIVTKSTAAPLGTGPSISVDVDSIPNGAAVLVDGDFSATTPGTLYFSPGPANYTLEMSLKGYKDKELVVENPPISKEIRVDLTRESGQ